MTAVFRAEAIGLGYAESAEGLERMALDLVPQEAARLGIPTKPADRQNQRPWLAEIVGLHPRYRYERRFLPARVDDSKAASSRNRGVWFEWTLEPGRVYQTRYRTSWKGGYQTRLLTVDETSGEVVDISEEDVAAWLTGRAPTSP